MSIQLPLYTFRNWLLDKGFDLAYPLYHWWGKRPAAVWPYTTESLLTLCEGTLGYEVGKFLQRHRLTLLPGYETHDICHVLLAYSPTAAEEAVLQWHLLGNGKRSPFCWLAVLAGSVLLPEHWPDFYHAFRRGNNQVRFFDWPYVELLAKPLSELQVLLASEVAQPTAGPNATWV